MPLIENKKRPQIENSWLNVLAQEFEKPYMSNLKLFLIKEKSVYKVFPPGELIFKAFDACPFKDVKVVILGQDPYHGEGQAEGLCFSVPKGVSIPPSLQNIFKEIQSDIGYEKMPDSGHLSDWAKQGVFLLNTTLTVREHQALSHKNQGWEIFTDAVINILSQERTGLIFLLWGSPAQSKRKLIDENKHTVLVAPHPSPLSAYRGFLGCKHFSQTNDILKKQGLEPINWIG